MRLDEDDLYDYEGEDSFDEDAAIDEVVNAVKAVGAVTSAQAEAELDKADWDVDVAIATLKRGLVAKQANLSAKPKQKPSPNASTAATNTIVSEKGKLTPLQMLAQRRANYDNNTSTDGVSSNKTGAKLSLAELAARRKTDRSVDSESKPAGSALDRLKQRRFKKESPEPAETANKAVNRPVDEKEPETRQLQKSTDWQPQFSYDIPHFVKKLPSEFGLVIGQGPSARTHETNFLETANGAQSAFSNPSPDDVVMNAQSSAFSSGAGGKMGKPESLSTKPASTKSADKKEKLNSKSSTASGGGVKVAKQSPTLAARLATLNLKPSCSFVVIGHVDAGKSTLMGRLLLDSGALPAQTVAKFEHESAKLGKSSFWLAWALDATAEERERGVTVDIGEAKFETKGTRYTVLDAPGHRDYVPNMIAGVSQADLAVLVVDADTNAFESGFALDGQTKEHAVLARSLGLTTIVVAVNKMDTQNWDHTRFSEIVELLTEFLTKKVGYSADQCVFVPTSGITGANVVKPPPQSSEDAAQLGAWYSGPTLVGALDTFAANYLGNSRRTDDALRFVVSNAFVEPFQSSTTLSGRVLSGGLEAGDVLELVQPTANLGVTATVKSVPSDYLVAGDLGDLKVDIDASSGVTIRPGDVLAGPNAGLHAVTRFLAKIRLFDAPKPVLPGSKLAFHLGRIEDTVKVVKILEPLGVKAAPARKIRHLGKGSAAVVELELSKPIVLAEPEVCKDLGRFVLRLGGATIGGGVVSSLS